MRKLPLQFPLLITLERSEIVAQQKGLNETENARLVRWTYWVIEVRMISKPKTKAQLNN